MQVSFQEALLHVRQSICTQIGTNNTNVVYFPFIPFVSDIRHWITVSKAFTVIAEKVAEAEQPVGCGCISERK